MEKIIKNNKKITKIEINEKKDNEIIPRIKKEKNITKTTKNKIIPSSEEEEEEDIEIEKDNKKEKLYPKKAKDIKQNEKYNEKKSIYKKENKK